MDPPFLSADCFMGIKMFGLADNHYFGDASLFGQRLHLFANMISDLILQLKFNFEDRIKNEIHTHEFDIFFSSKKTDVS